MPSSVNNLKTFGTQGAGYVETTVCNLQRHMIVNENVFILLCDFFVFFVLCFFKICSVLQIFFMTIKYVYYISFYAYLRLKDYADE